jgi:hypothetical protein
VIFAVNKILRRTSASKEVLDMVWLRNLTRGVRNIISWWSIIWKDRNWDYWYLLKIMDNKLKNMSEHLKNGYNENWEDIVFQINHVREIINRILKDDYTEDIYGFLDQKNKNQELTDLTEYEYSLAIQYQIKQEQEDMEYAFAYMTKFIQGWWD